MLNKCTHADSTAPKSPVERRSSDSTKSTRLATKQAIKESVSSWNAKQAGAKEGDAADFLSNLGEAQDYNINVDHGEQLCKSLAY